MLSWCQGMQKEGLFLPSAIRPAILLTVKLSFPESIICTLKIWPCTMHYIKKWKISNLLKYSWSASGWGHLGCFGIWEAQHSESLTRLILSLSEIPLNSNKPLAGFNRCNINIAAKWTGVISNKRTGKCTQSDIHISEST